MLLTYKIKHNRDFSEELKKARQVAEFCIKHRTQSRNLYSLPTQKVVSYDYNFPVSPHPADVKHIGLKSMLSSQILRKYSRNQELRSVKNIKLIIPSQAISVLKKDKTLVIPCLKLLLNCHFSNNFDKIS